MRKVIWQSKSCDWNWASISYGIRRSEKYQYFPIWNMSDNSSRSILFGIGLWYIEFTYHKKGRSFQNKWFAKYLPFRNRLFRVYNLLF